MKKRKPEKRLNKYIRFSGIAFQLGVAMYLAAYFGKKLDAYFSLEKHFFTLGLIIFTLVLSIWSITIQLKKIEEDS